MSTRISSAYISAVIFKHFNYVNVWSFEQFSNNFHRKLEKELNHEWFKLAMNITA